MKTSLMFTVTVSFLVLSAANLQQISFFLVAVTKSFFGSDIKVFKRTNFADSVVSAAIDELGMSKFLDENMVDAGGIVQSYGFMTYSINNILPQTEQPFLSSVVRPGSLKYNEIFIYGVEDNLLNSLSSEQFNPADYPKDPFNIGKNYGEKDVLKILSDANDYSQTEDLYDKIKLIPSNPNSKTMLSSNIYNFVVSEGLRGSLF